eukprot:11205238-Lingulodinium_polyedra.AAC.2
MPARARAHARLLRPAPHQKPRRLSPLIAVLAHVGIEKPRSSFQQALHLRKQPQPAGARVLHVPWDAAPQAGAHKPACCARLKVGSGNSGRVGSRQVRQAPQQLPTVAP